MRQPPPRELPRPARRVVAALALALSAAGCRAAPPPGDPAPVPTAAPTATAEAEPIGPVVISAVGDCTLGGEYNGKSGLTAFEVELAAHEGDLGWFFSGTRDLLSADDVTVANLETTLTTADEPAGDTRFHFRGKPSYARLLAQGSVEVANVANNHSHDFGERGYAETVKALHEAGVGVAGDKNVDGRTVRGVAVVNLGFTGGNDDQKKRMAAEIARYRSPRTVVIVSFHWGLEGRHDVIPVQRQLGRMAIDAGADLVLGTHPHVIQGIETYRGRHIVYSLGNFVFGGNVNPAEKEAIVYRETFAEQDGQMVPVSSSVIPVRVTSSPARNDFRPVALEGEEREQVLARVKKYSEELELR